MACHDNSIGRGRARRGNGVWKSEGRRAVTTEEEAVRAANARFYGAMSRLDLGEMDRVWLAAESVVCVHPGRAALLGYTEVRASWAAIFAATGEMSIETSDVRVTVTGEAAWVVCTEIISLRAEDELVTGYAQATNIFRRDGENWRMVVHHASPVPSRPAEEWPELVA